MSAISVMAKEISALQLEDLGEEKDYDRIVMTRHCEFLRFKLVEAGQVYTTFLEKVIYVSGKVENFDMKYSLLLSATETMSGNLDSVAIVKCIEKLFDKNCYDGHIRVFKRGYNKKDFEIYKTLTMEAGGQLNGEELYNIGFCFRKPRKTKDVDIKYLSPLIKGNCFELWNRLTTNYPKLKGLYSKYNMLTSEELKNVEEVCDSFILRTELPIEREVVPMKKLIKKFSIPIRGREQPYIELE